MKDIEKARGLKAQWKVIINDIASLTVHLFIKVTVLMNLLINKQVHELVILINNE